MALLNQQESPEFLLWHQPAALWPLRWDDIIQHLQQADAPSNLLLKETVDLAERERERPLTKRFEKVLK